LTNALVPAEAKRHLAILDKARQQLAEARSISEVKEIRAKSKALFDYFKSQREMGRESRNHAQKIMFLAEIRIGEMIADTKLKTNQHGASNDVLPALTDLGVTRIESSRFQAMARVEQQTFDDWFDGECGAGREPTRAGLVKLGRQSHRKDWAEDPLEPIEGVCTDLRELVEAGSKFRCIYADPPWSYDNQETRASTDNHYGTMTVEQICEEPVLELAADDAHLHLWTTNAFLFDARAVMAAWGFTYKSCFVWVKNQMGIGNYWRVSHEFMLLGVRGNATNFLANDQMSWICTDRTKHSRKPREVRQMVEKVSPGPYLEMYGREVIDGWTVYGNQIERSPLLGD